MNAPKKVRLKRISKACENCRKHKKKCSGTGVCHACAKYGERCIYRQQSRHKNALKNRAEEVTKTSQMESPSPLTGEYFGPASNLFFCQQLGQFLRELKGKLLATGSTIPRSMLNNLKIFQNQQWASEESQMALAPFSADEISSELMFLLIVSYLETWACPIPVFTAEELFQLAAQTWKHNDAMLEDKVLLYLIMLLGASSLHFDEADSSSESFRISRGLFDLAFLLTPQILSKISLHAVKVLFFFSLAAACFGDTALSYNYSGAAVRTLMAIGLHRKTYASSAKMAEQRHCRRLWVSIWQWEKYWSFCVGRPSCSRDDWPQVVPDCHDYDLPGYGERNRFEINFEHVQLRNKFSIACSKIQTQFYASEDSLSNTWLLVESFAQDLDEIYYGCKSDHLKREKVDETCGTMRLALSREWFWIRLYYLYLKLMIFRPFLIFNAYLNLIHVGTLSVIRERLLSGANSCVDLALGLSNFIIDFNAHIKMKQPISFICTYLETASTVVLFFVVSNIDRLLKQRVLEISVSLRKTQRFLKGCSVFNAPQTKQIVEDALQMVDAAMRKFEDEGTDDMSELSEALDSHTLNSVELQQLWDQSLDWHFAHNEDQQGA